MVPPGVGKRLHLSEVRVSGVLSTFEIILLFSKVVFSPGEIIIANDRLIECVEVQGVREEENEYGES